MITKSTWINVVAPMVAAAMLAFAGFQSFEEIKESLRRPQFVATATVEHTPSGEDPTVVYTRQYEENLVGTWSAKVIELKSGNIICSGKGNGDYRVEANEVLVTNLEWYVGKRCVLPEGTYVLTTTWNLLNESGNRVIHHNASPAFRVFPVEQRLGFLDQIYLQPFR